MNGILHRGRGFTGERVALVLTGTDAGSENAKTGAMQQVTALLDDGETGARDALYTGKDAAVCGVCPHRGGPALFAPMLGAALRALFLGAQVGAALALACVLVSLPRTCYVNIRSPETMSKKLRGMPVREGAKVTGYREGHIVPGLPLRLGAYGEVAGLAPLRKALGWARKAGRWTGYTHRWAERGMRQWRRLLMASCDSVEGAARAIRSGWRPFLVLPQGEESPREIEGTRMVRCPADPTLPKREKPVTCAACGVCDGTEKGRKVGVWIAAHGNAGKGFARIVATLSALFGYASPEKMAV